MEYRFQDWLQAASGNFLGNAAGDRWDAQRAFAATFSFSSALSRFALIERNDADSITERGR